jgi:hypothetical protein
MIEYMDGIKEEERGEVTLRESVLEVRPTKNLMIGYPLVNVRKYAIEKEYAPSDTDTQSFPTPESFPDGGPDWDHGGV